jgi:hypothetical protein
MILAVAAVAVIAVAVVAFFFLWGGSGSPTSSTTGRNNTSTSGSTGTSGSSGTGSTGSTGGSGSTSSTGNGTSTISMTVAAVDGTRPTDFNMTVHLFSGTTRISTYDRKDPISFGAGKDYTALQGIITFRGNNYREGASYGTADVKTAKLQVLWSVPTGSIAKASGTGSWTGSGWTGQPLIVKWPDDLKQIMNIRADKKAEPGLTEII